jgi:hypothetical protein
LSSCNTTQTTREPNPWVAPPYHFGHRGTPIKKFENEPKLVPNPLERCPGPRQIDAWHCENTEGVIFWME